MEEREKSEEKTNVANDSPIGDNVESNTENTLEEEKGKKEEGKEKPKRGRPNKASRRLNDELLYDSMFWFYVSLGHERSLEKVASHFDLELWIVKDASRKGNWQEKVKSLGVDETTTASEIVKYADSIQVSVLNQIINNPDAKPNDKIKALNALNEFVSRSSELVKKKRIVIEFKNKEVLQKIVDGLRDGSIYRNVGREDSFASPLPDDYIVNKD